VFAELKVKVPVPFFTKAPAPPLIVPAKEVSELAPPSTSVFPPRLTTEEDELLAKLPIVCVLELMLRSKVADPAIVTGPTAERDPESASVPVLMIVPPE
jgi:hypothetical protein